MHETSVAPPVKVASSSTTTAMRETGRIVSVASLLEKVASSPITAVRETVRFVSFVASSLVNVASSLITAMCETIRFVSFVASLLVKVASSEITVKRLIYGLAYGGILYFILILCKEFLDSNFIHWKAFLICFLICLVILYWKVLMGLVFFVYLLYCVHIHDD